MNIYRPDVNRSKYIVATYNLKCRGTLSEGAWALAVGQSIGNPSIRNKWETEELIDEHACIILHDQSELGRRGMTVSMSQGTIQIGFPLANINLRTDGVSQLLCQLMGGQMDIDSIVGCRLLDIDIPTGGPNGGSFRLAPKYGVSGIRDFTGCHGKPLLGGIVKPKVGLKPPQLLELVQQMVDGGVNFIKEDEIMSNPACCPLKERVPLIANYLATRAPHVIYAVCITSDPAYVVRRAQYVHELGGNAVHVNFWSGLGVYRSIRELDLPLFLFFQKSGDKVLTDPQHRFSIAWKVICKLAALSGIDFIHAGMWGGYMQSDEEELTEVMEILHHYQVLPSLSCGMKPDLVPIITKRFGVDYMATSGGYIHGHPEGTLGGTRAMRAEIDAL